MSTSRSWFEFTSYNLLPVVTVDVENVNVVHPVNSIVSAKVDNFRVNQTTCCGNASTWNISTNLRLYPGKGLSIQVKDIVKLTQLIWLTSKDVYLFVKSYG